MSAGAVALQGASLPTANTPTYQFGSDGTNLTPGVTLFDANGVAIGPANPLQAQSEPRGGTAYNTASDTAGYQVKSGAGIWQGISINTAGLTSTATLYDGLSTAGTKLATISTLAQNSMRYDIAFATGLFLVLTGGTPADITITYF